MGHPLTWIPIVRGEGMLYIYLVGFSPIKDGEYSHVNCQLSKPKKHQGIKKKKKKNSKWEPDVFSDNGIKLRLFVDLASVADREILIVVWEMATSRSK